MGEQTVQTTDALEPLRIFIGWDSRQPEAYEVARYSLESRATVPVSVEPIKLGDLRARGLYSRPDDVLASTEFTYSRFLAPTLAGFRGWALFCDCDFLWLDDIAGLLQYTRSPKALWCVKHDHLPPESVKMDGRTQTLYPRKNWSSLMLFNCDHPTVHRLTAEIVNRESGAYLHQMKWAADDEIGDLPVDWNWLEGWNEKPATGTPKAIHFTRGGPWLGNCQAVDYAELWGTEYAAMLRKVAANPDADRLTTC